MAQIKVWSNYYVIIAIISNNIIQLEQPIMTYQQFAVIIRWLDLHQPKKLLQSAFLLNY